MELTKEELALLKGGHYSSDVKTKLADDKPNTNDRAFCTCNYENYRIVENSNMGFECSCNCIR